MTQLAKLPSPVWAEIMINFVNIHWQHQYKNSYCYCMNVADGDLFNDTA